MAGGGGRLGKGRILIANLGRGQWNIASSYDIRRQLATVAMSCDTSSS